MAMLAEQPGYRSYLLRLWRVGSADAPSWRVSLEDVRTHERRNFASLEQLVAFLKEQTDRNTEQADRPDNGS
jgi:hypothetical protein